jgi:hypothetical protein
MQRKMKNPVQRHPAVLRALAISRVRSALISHSFPRMQMGLIVSLTGASGLLASFALLQLGFGSMTLRYPLALGFAYLFFLFLVWLWLCTNASDYVDVPDPSNVVPHGPSAPDAPGFGSGGGGDFGGGGASGSFDGGVGSPMESGLDGPLESAGEAVGAVAEAEELAIPLIAVALAVGLALASLYVVYIAPTLFAEVLVDGALSYALFRHFRAQDRQHWLSTAWRRTALPFIATALFLAGTGAAMSAYAPGAKSLGQVVKHAGTKSEAR